MNNQGDMGKGAAHKQFDFNECVVHLVSHIGKSPLNDLAGLAGQQGTLDDALTIIQMNYSSDLLELFEGTYLDQATIDKRYQTNFGQINGG